MIQVPCVVWRRYAGLFGVLLFGSFIIPMAQYFWCARACAVFSPLPPSFLFDPVSRRPPRRRPSPIRRQRAERRWHRAPPRPRAPLWSVRAREVWVVGSTRVLSARAHARVTAPPGLSQVRPPGLARLRRAPGAGGPQGAEEGRLPVAEVSGAARAAAPPAPRRRASPLDRNGRLVFSPCEPHPSAVRCVMALTTGPRGVMMMN